MIYSDFIYLNRTPYTLTCIRITVPINLALYRLLVKSGASEADAVSKVF
jgi:hypothetical protein